MDGTSVGNRLDQVKKKIQQAEERAGREPGSARLLAVSKAQSLLKIRAAFDGGQRDFAENYVQEAVEKLEQLESMPIDWHFIGRIQSNKVKALAGKFKYIHSVDRLSIAEALNTVSAKSPQRIFVQFNVAGETSKGGAAEADLIQLIGQIVHFKNLSLQGLMVMPPLAESPEATRPHFQQARRTLDHIRSQMSVRDRVLHPLDQLSMGTSQDFMVAVEEGATWVRVGSEIFGAREEIV